MTTTKSFRCTLGRHHWHFATEDDILVRTCTDCGRRRYHGPARSDRGSRDDAFVAGGWGFGGGLGGWGFGGGLGGGFDGGGCGGDGGGGC